jgi:hypothetical protein
MSSMSMTMMLGGGPAGNGGNTGTFNGGGWLGAKVVEADDGAVDGAGLTSVDGVPVAAAAVGVAEGVWAANRPAKKKKEAR